jgi:YidC/Oxa1 family membrane protein insertase
LAEFTNPNQSGGGQDNRSFLVMLFVIAGVLFGMQYLRSKNTQPTASPNTPAITQSSTPATQSAATAAASTPAAANPGVPTVQAQAESSIVVENELYRITFSNRGGHVTSWILKGYKDADGNPLDLVHGQAAEKFGYPLSLYTYDADLNKLLQQALFVPSTTEKITAPGSLTFKFSDGSVDVTKTFSFDETYVIHADVQVLHNGSPVRTLISWPGGFGDQYNAQTYASSQIDYSQSAKDTHLAAKKVSGGETINGPFDWAGVSDSFFAAVLLPDSPETASLVTFHNNLDVAKTIHRTGFGSGSPSKSAINVPVLGAAVGDLSGRTQARIFVGPKAINVLKKINATPVNGHKVTLEPLLEFGFWGAIGKYLFLALQFIHTHVTGSWPGSWGWAIIILTIIVNLLMLPFRIKTMKNGLKMQRIQPQMDAIKNKYKGLKPTDPKRNEMNVEIMKLQKDNGVNMFGGCIPTLVTLPLLWAFFTMLPRVVELRNAHWLWVPDLQSADPWHILPIVMVISQVLMQLYTPSPGVDPQQQKMMAFTMPAITGYFVWTYGAGLGLYWAVGNFIGIASQLVMNRTSLGQEMREIAAKRARRKAGTGKTPTTLSGKR